jgi:rubrerythrin
MADQTPRTVERIAQKLRTSSPESRRHFLKRSAQAGGGALALAFAGSNAALAGHNPYDDDVNEDDATDVEVLQFALTLEHLENAFYREVGGQFDEKDYRRAEFLRGFGDRVRGDVIENVQDIGAHEQTHVDTLVKVLEDLGEDPVEEACYDFGVDTVDDFANIARVLENTGVTAYTGSIADVDTPALATAGATIATVEARHASYLNFLTGEDPFPAAFDTPKTRKEVFDAASGFIVECE